MSCEDNLNLNLSSVFSLLECPICLDVAYPPIYQCANGHLVCCVCVRQIHACAICRQRMPDAPIRNRLVEKLTEGIIKSCPHAKAGCKAQLKITDYDAHVNQCDYEKKDCCRQIGLDTITGCIKSVSKREIGLHMKNEHKLSVVDGCVADIQLDLFKTYPYSLKWLPVTFSCYNEWFFILGKHIRRNNVSIASWKCVIAARQNVAKRFNVQMSISNRAKDLKLKWKGPVVSCENIDAEKGCFSLPLHTIELFDQSANANIVEWSLNIAINNANAQGLKLRRQTSRVQIVKTFSVRLQPQRSWIATIMSPHADHIFSAD